MSTNLPMLVTFAVYLAGMLLIGWRASRRVRTTADFILGGRSLNPWITALATGASDMSGWLLLGLPGALYAAGLGEAWIAVGLVAGAWLNWRYVAERLRVFTERSDDALTLPDWFAARFPDRARLLRGTSAAVILVFFAIYASSGMVAGARLFESLVPGIDYRTAMLSGAAVTIAYTALGGFLAVTWTEAIQAGLMLFALLLAPLVVIHAAGGPVDALAAIAAVDPARLDPLAGASVVGIVSLLGWGLGYFGQPHILNRFMAARSRAAIRPARRIAMAWMVLCLAGAIATGFFGIARFAADPAGAAVLADNPERVFLLLAQSLFSPWIAGLLLAAVLAAIMSTLSSQLLVCASAVSEDFWRAWLRPDAGDRELVWVGRIALLAVAAIALWLAADPGNRVLDLVAYAWAGFGAAFGPLVILALRWRRMTATGALAGMVTGAATVLVWKQAGWLGLYELVPAFALAWLAIVVVSRLDRPPPAEQLARFDGVAAEFRRG